MKRRKRVIGQPFPVITCTKENCASNSSLHPVQKTRRVRGPYANRISVLLSAGLPDRKAITWTPPAKLPLLCVVVVTAHRCTKQDRL